MRILDITLPLSAALPTWDGDPGVSIQRVATAQHADPASYNLSRITLGTHAGTHVDPPLHFGASPGVDRLALETLCGPARVIDLRDGPRAIDRDTLRAHDLRGVGRLLLATHRGEMHVAPMRRDHAYLTEPAARMLREELGVLLVGTDCFSIDPSDGSAGSGFPAHRALLQDHGALHPAPVVIVEGLRLTDIEPGDYELWCLPLPLVDGDGAPVRAVLARR